MVRIPGSPFLMGTSDEQIEWLASKACPIDSLVLEWLRWECS